MSNRTMETRKSVEHLSRVVGGVDDRMVCVIIDHPDGGEDYSVSVVKFAPECAKEALCYYCDFNDGDINQIANLNVDGVFLYGIGSDFGKVIRIV